MARAKVARAPNDSPPATASPPEAVPADEPAEPTPIRDIAGIRQALRDAKRARGITFATIDHISGLPDGYSSKVMAPNPPKMYGNQSLGEIMQAVGKMLIMVDDPEAIARVQHRWVKSQRPDPETPPKFSIAGTLKDKAFIRERDERRQRGLDGALIGISNSAQISSTNVQTITEDSDVATTKAALELSTHAGARDCDQSEGSGAEANAESINLDPPGGRPDAQD
ncbi:MULTISPECIES: hypothetical protein [Bradyrhizobium]|uniref:hypothetical protein n=1 Tax=Bradyrhizobium TaxID=374 RepID=UPI001EDA2247|nr:hypothetical protein [Bradyrhizobium zhengyangense]MCG2639658.1 hypothetical protein [Bradyrhizobium zhengyangense]